MTTTDAALAAHCTRQAIQQAIKRGKLPARKVGRDWQIDPKDFDAWLSSPRKVGRPRKNKNSIRASYRRNPQGRREQAMKLDQKNSHKQSGKIVVVLTYAQLDALLEASSFRLAGSLDGYALSAKALENAHEILAKLFERDKKQ